MRRLATCASQLGWLAFPFALATATGSASGQIIDFETAPGPLPADDAVLFDEYQASHGVRFYVDTDGDGLLELDKHPRFEERGQETGPGAANGFTWDGGGSVVDQAASPFESQLGEFFVARNLPLSEGFEGLFIVYDSPVSALSGQIWDMDLCEGWEVSAMGPDYLTDADDVIASQTFQAYRSGSCTPSGGTPFELDGRPLNFAFDLPGAPSIHAVRIQATGPIPGVAFDNFSPSFAGGFYCEFGTRIIDFDPLAHAGGLDYHDDYFEEGFRVSSIGSPFGVYGPAFTPPYCGETAISRIDPSYIEVARQNEPVPGQSTTSFDPVSVDVCEGGFPLPPTTSIEFFGEKAGGGSVSVTFPLDGVTGPETFLFPKPDFTDLVRLWWTEHGQVDNITFCDGDCTLPPHPMLGWWSGDACEVGGLPLLGVLDRSGSQNHASWVAGPNCATGPEPFVGAGAMAFDGSGYLEVDSDARLRSLANGDFTIDAWVNTSSASGLQTIMEQGGDPGFHFGLVLGDALRLIVCEGGTCTVTTSENLAGVAGLPTLANGEWHHVAVTRDKGASPEVEFLLGGTPVQATVGVIPLPVGPLDELRIGDAQRPMDSFVGGIDELQVFDRVVDQATLHRVAGTVTAGKCKDSDFVGFMGSGSQSGSAELALAVCSDCELGQPTTIETVSVATGAGQSGSSLASALASAINGSSALQSLGITATAIGNQLQIHGGEILDGYVSDPSFAVEFPSGVAVPALAWAGLLSGAGLPALAGLRALRRRPGAAGSLRPPR